MTFNRAGALMVLVLGLVALRAAITGGTGSTLSFVLALSLGLFVLAGRPTSSAAPNRH